MLWFYFHVCLFLDELDQGCMHIFGRVRNSDPSSQDRVLEMMMVTFGRNQEPTSFFQNLNDFPAAHAVAHRLHPWLLLTCANEKLFLWDPAAVHGSNIRLRRSTFIGAGNVQSSLVSAFFSSLSRTHSKVDILTNHA